MAGAAFAGGAFVQLQLKGTDQVGSELDAMASDMKKFKKLARDVSQNFGVEAAVDSLGNFTVKGEAANAATKVLADELQRMEGIQARTSVTVKNVNKALSEEASQKQRTANLEKSLAEVKDRAAKKEKERVARQKANVAEFQRNLKFQSKQYEEEYNKQVKTAKESEKAKQKAQKDAIDKYQRDLKNNSKLQEDITKRNEKKKQAAIKQYQKMLKFNSKVAEDQAKKAERAQKEAAKRAAAAQKKAEKEKAEATRKSVARRIALLRKLFTIEKKTFQLQKLAVGLRTIGTIAKAIAGLVTGFTDVAQAVDKVGKAANRAGVSVGFMSQLRFAAEQSGASFEQLAAGMKAMQRNIGLFAIGTGEAKGALEAMGVSYADLESLSPEEQFMKLSELLAGVEDANLRAALATRIFGEGGQELANMLENGADGIKAYQEQADALGLTMTESQTKGAAQFNDSLNIMSKTMEMIRSQLVAAMGPALEELAYFFNALVQVVMEWDEGVNGASNAGDFFMGIVEILKTVLYSAVAVWYEFNAGIQASVAIFNRTGQGLYTLVSIVATAYKMISQSTDKFAAMFGLDISSAPFFESIRDQARAMADEYGEAADEAERKMMQNKDSASKFWNAAMNPDDSFINRRVESKMEKAREATENITNTAPPIEVKMDDETKAAATLLADFGSSTEYGIEGLKKAQKNVDEKQIALLKKIAENTKDTPAIAGVP
jgi:hypothetical protein